MAEKEFRPAKAVYAAEERLRLLLQEAAPAPLLFPLHGSTFVIEQPQTFQTLEMVQRFLDKIVLTKECREILGGTPLVTVQRSKYADRSSYRIRSDRTSVMSLVGNQFDGYDIHTVVHELAHHVSSGHGHAFMSAYVRLADLMVDAQYSFVLGHLIGLERIRLDLKP